MKSRLIILLVVTAISVMFCGAKLVDDCSWRYTTVYPECDGVDDEACNTHLCGSNGSPCNGQILRKVYYKVPKFITNDVKDQKGRKRDGTTYGSCYFKRDCHESFVEGESCHLVIPYGCVTDSAPGAKCWSCTSGNGEVITISYEKLSDCKGTIEN